MSILMDIHEPTAIEDLLSQMVPTTRSSINPALPDYYLMLPTMTAGIQRKKASEFVGAIDACEAQLRGDLEQQNCDYLILLVEGGLRPSPDGGTFTYSWREDKVWQDDGVSAFGSLSFSRRHYRQSYKGVMQFFSRLWALGIPVIRTEDTETTAIAIAALHADLEKPDELHKTFNRLIRDKYYLSETDQRKRQIAEFLMGIPSVGEELALSLTDAYPSFESLWSQLREDEKVVAKTVLRGGKRTVGPASISKMKRFLGL